MLVNDDTGFELHLHTFKCKFSHFIIDEKYELWMKLIQRLLDISLRLLFQVKYMIFT